MTALLFRRGLWFVLLSSLAGCGAAMEPDDGGETDAGDDGAVLDSGLFDASMALDAGRDASVDSGPEPCWSPAATRAVTCGNCGLGSQTCWTDGFWHDDPRCFGQGECAAGAVQREPIAMCGEHARICDRTCSWRAWEITHPGGECEPGAMDWDPTACTGGATRPRRCTDACVWEEAGVCTYHCTRPPAPSTTISDPVCVPAGEFVLGADDVTNAMPERIVYLSEFYIDRFPVTAERYRACMDAGACSITTNVDYFNALRPTQFAAGMRQDDAEAFCTWDGGALVRELQWEKAARGPSPDRRGNTWGDGVGMDCVHHPAMACAEYPFDVDAFPAAVSPYGVIGLGLTWERVSTRFRAGWDWLLDVPDPPEPVPAIAYPSEAMRGRLWADPTTMTASTYDDSAVSRRANAESRYEAFRCVY